MEPTRIEENGCTETYFGDVKMPHYAGVLDELHQVTADWNVSGVLGDCRVFEVCVKNGFEFDGCSIPRALWRLCGEPFEAPRVSAALAHDWLYAAHVCDRETADGIFREICKMVGVGAIRRNVEYWALRMFGGVAWKSHEAQDENFANAHGALWLGGEIQKENKK